MYIKNIYSGTHSVFNFFFSAVVSTWRTDCVKVGADVLSHPGRKLVGDETAKSRLAVVKVTESQFVDDLGHLALYAFTCEKLEHVTTGFVRRTSRWLVFLRLKGWLLVMV